MDPYSNSRSKLNYVLHGKPAGKYVMLFVILAKLLTQTKWDETDYILKNLTTLNFFHFYYQPTTALT